jgi:hypothetical protein
MRRIMSIIVWVAIVLQPGETYAQNTTGKTSVSPMPRVFQAVGTTDVFYEPTRWPKFGKSSSDNERCADNLRNNLSMKKKSETHPENFSFNPRTIISKTINFKKDVGSAYKKTAKIIVAWTVRVEAYQSIINPWTNNPRLCHPWHGTIYEDFPGGDVQTSLYVNGKQVGGNANMTFPPLGTGKNVNPSDPTITGSVTLTPQDLGGEFPDELTFEVKWMNDTFGAQVKSPAYMRNMTIFVLPISQTSE